MIKRNIFWLFILPCVLMGCDKFLDREPQNKISTETLFSDIEGAKAALSGVYFGLWGTNYYNGPRMVYPEAVGGNVIPVNGARQTLMDVYSFSADPDSSGMNGVYSVAYRILNNISNIITRVPHIPNGLQSEKNEIMAQAYGIRALLHFDLLQLYAQPFSYTRDASHVGIVLSNEPILVVEAQRRRASVAEVYASIESDLNRAEDLFKNRGTVFTGNSVSYFNASALKALKARIYLHKGDWEQAYNYSDAVIRENYSLYTNEEYVSSWTTRAGKETIFELSTPNEFSGNSLGSYYTNEKENEYYQFSPSRDLLAIFSDGDVRRSGGIFKYATYGPAATSIKLIRLSEMYLIRAEAAAETNRTSQGIADLNVIRLRGNPDQLHWTNTETEALLAEIYTERRRELCIEGFFFFALMRLGKSVSRSDCNGVNCNVNYPSQKFVLPIPMQSVTSNSNMEQNPSY